MDLRSEGLKSAALRLCPQIGGSPGAIDASAAMRMPGVERIVMLPAYAVSTAGFGVIARNSWHALRALAAVQVDSQPRLGGALDTAAIERSLENAVKGGKDHVFHETGNVERAENGAARTVEAWYRSSLPGRRSR